MYEDCQAPSAATNKNNHAARGRNVSTDRLKILAIQAMVPILVAYEPKNTNKWGGLIIFTSRP
jgi:hypothetical protein